MSIGENIFVLGGYYCQIGYDFFAYSVVRGGNYFATKEEAIDYIVTPARNYIKCRGMENFNRFYGYKLKRFFPNYANCAD